MDVLHTTDGAFRLLQLGPRRLRRPYLARGRLWRQAAHYVRIQTQYQVVGLSAENLHSILDGVFHFSVERLSDQHATVDIDVAEVALRVVDRVVARRAVVDVRQAELVLAVEVQHKLHEKLGREEDEPGQGEPLEPHVVVQVQVAAQKK